MKYFGVIKNNSYENYRVIREKVFVLMYSDSIEYKMVIGRCIYVFCLGFRFGDVWGCYFCFQEVFGEDVKISIKIFGGEEGNFRGERVFGGLRELFREVIFELVFMGRKY